MATRCVCIGALVPDVLTGRPVWRMDYPDEDCAAHGTYGGAAAKVNATLSHPTEGTRMSEQAPEQGQQQTQSTETQTTETTETTTQPAEQSGGESGGESNGAE